MAVAVVLCLIAVIVFSVLVGVIAMLWFNQDRYWILRQMRRLPTTRVADVQPGKVCKLVGTLRYAAEPLVAPLSGRPCACYEARVVDRNEKLLHPPKERQTTDFYVEDETGRALVECSAMKSVIAIDDEESAGWLREAAPRTQAFLKRHGKTTHDLLGVPRSLECEEGVLEEGEQVVAIGRPVLVQSRQPGIAGSGYRESPKQVVLRARRFQPVYVSDQWSVTTESASSLLWQDLKNLLNIGTRPPR